MNNKNTANTTKTHIIDVSGKRLGKVATQVVVLLKGKHKASYLPYKYEGDKVVIVNSDHLDIETKKAEVKIYHRYSGYPGGISSISLEKLFKKNSREVVRQAVYGMLPKNRLRRLMLNNLEIHKNNPVSEKRDTGDMD